MSPFDFLTLHAPFSDLGPAARTILASGLEVLYVEAGEQLLHEGGQAATMLSIVRKGEVELRSSDGQPRKLGPGDCFGQASLISGRPPLASAHAVGDCLLYTISKPVFDQLSRIEPLFAGFFLADLARRLRTRTRAPVATDRASLAAPVETLIQRPPVCGPIGLRVGEAATIMAEAGVSSLLLVDPAQPVTPVGMLTDRDLRRRVLAAGGDGQWPVTQVMSTPVITASIDATLFDCMLTMVERGIHHLPIVDARGHARGVLTHDDLLRYVFHSPASLHKRIRRLDLDAPASSYGSEVAGLVAQLVNSGLGSVQIGSMVATLNDTLVARFCTLAQERLGPPPVPYVWIAFGSEGRREQALMTDQDNALVFGDCPPDQQVAVERYFEAFAKLVVDATIASGIPACKGGYMATNWHKSQSDWTQTFASWARTPSPESVMHAANFFDFRGIHGQLPLDRLERAALDCVKQPRFMMHFVRQALDKRPRLAILSRWLDLDRSVDLKAEGLVPLVGLARVYALSAGLRGGSTLERLAYASQHGVLDSDRAESLGEAFRYLFRLRLEHQLSDNRAGVSTNNEIQLRSLPALDRRHLRDCLAYIDDAQSAAARHFGTQGLG